MSRNFLILEVFQSHDFLGRQGHAVCHGGKIGPCHWRSLRLRSTRSSRWKYRLPLQTASSDEFRIAMLSMPLGMLCNGVLEVWNWH